MNRDFSDFMHRISSKLPLVGLIGLGASGYIHDNHTAVVAAELGLGAIGTIMAIRDSEKRKREEETKEIKHHVDHAPIVRPDAVNLGTITSMATIKGQLEEALKIAKSPNSPLNERGQQSEIQRAEKNLDRFRRLRERVAFMTHLGPTEKRALGFPNEVVAFATPNSVLVLDGAKEDLRDLVIASASGAYLRDESNKPMRLFKPASITMAVLIGQYDDEQTAREAWDHAYHEMRGKKLILEAYRQVPNGNLGGCVMDGPIALEQRGGMVIPYRNGRYLGLDDIQGVETMEDALNVVHNAIKHGIYDADFKQFVKIRDYEIASIAAIVLENSHERDKQHDIQLSY